MDEWMDRWIDETMYEGMRGGRLEDCRLTLYYLLQNRVLMTDL